MARKKAKKEVSAVPMWDGLQLSDNGQAAINSNKLKKIRATLAKKHGADTVTVDEELKALSHIPYGISCQSAMMNLVIGRPGFPAGRLTEIIGFEASSKSTIGYHLLAECQRYGGVGVLVESEEAFETARLKKLGIDVDNLIICQPNYMEQAFQMMSDAVLELRHKQQHRGPIVIVWDSVAATPVLAETESEYDDDTMAAAARFLSKAMRKFIRTVAKEKVVLIFMNQMKTNLNKYDGDKWISYGGKSIKFHASVRFIVNARKSDLEVGDKGELVGQWINVRNIKNKIAVPYKNERFFLNFNKGIDQYRDCWEFGIATKAFKALGKGRLSYRKKIFTKKLWTKFVKKKWGTIHACRDFLTARAIRKGYLKPYGEPGDMEGVNSKIRRSKAEKRTKTER